MGFFVKLLLLVLPLLVLLMPLLVLDVLRCDEAVAWPFVVIVVVLNVNKTLVDKK